MAKKNETQIFLECAAGNYSDICAKYYFDFLKNETNISIAAEKLAYLFKWDYSSTKENTVDALYTQDEYTIAIKKSSEIIEKIVDNMINNNVDETVFYETLWKTISEKGLFPTDIDCIGAIIFLFAYPKIPYFQLEEGLKMEDEAFQLKSIGMVRQIQKAIYILNRGYKQKTEVASQLIKIILELDDFDKQTVFLANILGLLEISKNKEATKD